VNSVVEILTVSQFPIVFTILREYNRAVTRLWTPRDLLTCRWLLAVANTRKCGSERISKSKMRNISQFNFAFRLGTCSVKPVSSFSVKVVSAKYEVTQITDVTILIVNVCDLTVQPWAWIQFQMFQEVVFPAYILSRPMQSWDLRLLCRRCPRWQSGGRKTGKARRSKGET